MLNRRMGRCDGRRERGRSPFIPFHDTRHSPSLGVVGSRPWYTPVLQYRPLPTSYQVTVRTLSQVGGQVVKGRHPRGPVHERTRSCIHTYKVDSLTRDLNLRLRTHRYIFYSVSPLNLRV